MYVVCTRDTALAETKRFVCMNANWVCRQQIHISISMLAHRWLKFDHNSGNKAVTATITSLLPQNEAYTLNQIHEYEMRRWNPPHTRSWIKKRARGTWCIFSHNHIHKFGGATLPFQFWRVSASTETKKVFFCVSPEKQEHINSRHVFLSFTLFLVFVFSF